MISVGTHPTDTYIMLVTLHEYNGVLEHFRTDSIIQSIHSIQLYTNIMLNCKIPVGTKQLHFVARLLQ